MGASNWLYSFSTRYLHENKILVLPFHAPFFLDEAGEFLIQLEEWE